MKENIASRLTAKDDRNARVLADKVITESLETDDNFQFCGVNMDILPNQEAVKGRWCRDGSMESVARLSPVQRGL